MVHWLIDTYLDPMITLNDFTHRSALVYPFWEIARDFDGTVESLDLYAGGNTLSSNRPDLDYIVADLVANFDLIPVNYRSSLYNVTFIEDITNGFHDYQSMVLVTPIQVPEPAGVMLLGLSGVMMGLRRRRHA